MNVTGAVKMPEKNWPNPDLPGVPMFAERDGAHVFENENDEDLHLVYHWDSGKQCWSDFPVNTTKQWDRKQSLQDYKYVGPVLTPMQINEMLAAERERCAVIADAKRDAVWDGKIGSLAKDKLRTGYAQSAITIGEAIRNLGAAP
ncbi:hypothetical protein [Acetobacter phage phiAP1]|nr:hypothetical protein [Acetobacter phage phiAP1]